MARRAEKGRVYLVGAGPGDPELLTVRAMSLLQSADVVFHDDLVPDAILSLARPDALVTSVGKRCGRPRITQAGIHGLLIEAARGGGSVVRLKSGDPMIFGRAGEEIAALQNADVPFEVIPGVTAALAAGASLALPLTDRTIASKLILVTGHHAQGKVHAQPLWSGPIPADATLAVYMPGRDLGRLARDLQQCGLAAETPMAAVSSIGTEHQFHVTGRLGDVELIQPGPAPLLVLVGPAMEKLLKDQEILRSALLPLHAIGQKDLY